MPDVATTQSKSAPYYGNPAISGPGAAGTVDIDAEKHNVNPLSKTVRAIRCGTGGTMKFHAVGDAANVYRTITMVDGEVYALTYVDQVWDTGTSATGLLGTV